MPIAGAEQGKRRGKEALGPKSFLTCEVGQQHKQDRRPGHGSRPAAPCHLEPLLLGPDQLGSTLLPALRRNLKGSLHPWFLLTTLPGFLGSVTVTYRNGLMEDFVALGLTQGSILGGSTCYKVMGQNPGASWWAHLPEGE